MSAAAVVLPPLEGQQAQAWDTLMAVAEDLGEGWTLIGGQMVLLHQTARSPAGAQTVGGAGLRWSYDLDVVVNLRTSRSRMSHIDSVLTDHGFTQQVVPIRRPDPQGTPPHPPSCPDRRSGSRCARRGRSRSVWRCWRLRPHPIPADMGGMRGEARLDKVLAREDIESTFADLKYRIRWKLCSHMEDRFRFNISCYQLLRLSRTLCEFHSRSP